MNVSIVKIITVYNLEAGKSRIVDTNNIEFISLCKT